MGGLNLTLNKRKMEKEKETYFGPYNLDRTKISGINQRLITNITLSDAGAVSIVDTDSYRSALI